MGLSQPIMSLLSLGPNILLISMIAVGSYDNGWDQRKVGVHKKYALGNKTMLG
jgi:hypothetical protein